MWEEVDVSFGQRVTERLTGGPGLDVQLDPRSLSFLPPKLTFIYPTVQRTRR